MAKITFTSNLKRHVNCPSQIIEASSLASALQQVFAENQRLAGYILDDQKRLRKNIAIFVDGQMVKDRLTLSDPIKPDSDIYILQALSGG